jgi:HAD superfamily hydrolase (TIGR01509 family)
VSAPRPAPELAAILFDFDGLIVDTEWPEYHAVATIFADHGLPYPPHAWAVTLGSVDTVDWRSELAAALGRRFDEQSHAALDEERRRRARAASAAAMTPLPGVVDLLDAAAAAGVALAVASSSPRAWVVGHLDSLGLTDRFAHVITRDDVAAAKPAPDLYLAACAALGVPTAAAVALEDSANGVTAARAAGMPVVAVPNRLTALLDLSHASAVVTTLAGVSLAWLAALLGSHPSSPPAG